NLAIGSGVPSNLPLASVNWASGSKYIEVAVDPTGTGTPVVIGTPQLLSVPYAIYSNTAGNALSGGSGGASSLIPATGISITGNTISAYNDQNIWNAGSIAGVKINQSLSTQAVDGTVLYALGGVWSAIQPKFIQRGGTIITGDIYNGLTISTPAINFTTGTGISIVNGQISNTLPDQPIFFNNSATTSITGTYPNFTIVNAPTQAPTLAYSVASNTLSILGGNSLILPTASNTNAGLMSIGQVNALAGVSTLAGLDIQTSNPSTLAISKSGSIYTLSVPTTPGGLLNFDQTTSLLSISNGNTISIPSANTTNAGLMSASDFNNLQYIKGVNVVSGSTNVSISSTSGPVFSISVTAPTAQTLTSTGNNILGLTGSTGQVTLNDANGSTSGLMSSGNFNTLTTLSTLLGFDIQGVPGNTIVTRSGSLYTISVPSSVAPTLITTTPGVIASGLVINIDSASSSGPGLLSNNSFNYFSGKQNALVPGVGIAINGNIISATGIGSQWITNVNNDIYNGNTGNVGIGTSTPNEKLTVLGNASVTGNGSFGDVFIKNMSAPSAGLIRRVGIDITGKLVDITGTANFGDIKGTGPVTVTGPGATNSIWGGDATISISLASTSSAGLMSASDYNKLLTLSGVSNALTTSTTFGGDLIGTYNALTVSGIRNIPVSNTPSVNGEVLQYNGGVLTFATISGSSTSVQTLTLVGNNLSISGGNFVSLPSSTTSIVGIGLSVTSLPGNTYQITNTYTSSGIGYYSTTPGLSVSSVTGAIGLAIASINGFGILSYSEYNKLNSLYNISLAGANITVSTI
ncbi:MAG: hypothetical protein K2Q22_05740, partial [Cytophagales bacterium]|nr:hypothetical protein [Cytophagales bacterium]